ncbi:hypothetical protein LJR009_002549 [Bosea sp. LjRoot9]|uniref:hypothetical protein n=1 Tax=Bosea sp. LjRoot9 TaxID=3342341 RepID=UPI003ED0BBCA
MTATPTTPIAMIVVVADRRRAPRAGMLGSAKRLRGLTSVDMDTVIQDGTHNPYVKRQGQSSARRIRMRAFSSEADTGSREENAPKQRARAIAPEQDAKKRNRLFAPIRLSLLDEIRIQISDGIAV